MANNAAPDPRGKALLLTRPAGASDRFAASLDPGLMAQVRLCISPLIEIVPLDRGLPRGDFAGYIFSSARAVDAVEKGRGRLCHCVGHATAARARARDWTVGVVDATADALVAALLSRRVDAPLLHVAGRHRRGEIAARLTAAGLPTQVREVYDQRLLPLSGAAAALIAAGGPVIVPLFSPRSAAQFAAQAPAGRLWVLGMSGAVADALGDRAVERLEIANAPDAEEMRRGVEMLLRQDSLA